MVEALDQLGLTQLVTSIDGLSPVGAASILAETGDLTRFTSARAIVKLAGLAPRERLSGTFAGKARLSGAGRPGLRTAAWRAVWGCQHTNTVYHARYRHLTTREHNKLKPTQAQTVLAAALLRQLWAVVTTGQAWDPVIAANGLTRHLRSRSWPDPAGVRVTQEPVGASLPRHRDTKLDAHHRRPRPLVEPTRSHAAGTNPIRYAGTDERSGTPTP